MSDYFTPFVGHYVRITSGPDIGRCGFATHVVPAQTSGLFNPAYLNVDDAYCRGSKALYDPATASFYPETLVISRRRETIEAALQALAGRRVRLCERTQWDRQGLAVYHPATAHHPASLSVANDQPGWRYWLSAVAYLPEQVEIIADQM